LQEHKVPDAAIALLTVRIALQFTSPKETTCAGVYNFNELHIITAYVPVWCSIEISRLNHVLLHETRHLIQNTVLGERNSMAREMSLEWKDRPHEIDAETFAEQHNQQSVFIEAKASSSIRVTNSTRNWWT
jgi:hypothetical protein